jgi:hypothetical protein
VPVREVENEELSRNGGRQEGTLQGRDGCEDWLFMRGEHE